MFLFMGVHCTNNLTLVVFKLFPISVMTFFAPPGFLGLCRPSFPLKLFENPPEPPVTGSPGVSFAWWNMLFGYGCFPKRFRGTLNRFVKGGFWGVFRSSGGMTPEGPGTPLDGYSNKLYLYTVMRPYDVCLWCAVGTQLPNSS